MHPRRPVAGVGHDAVIGIQPREATAGGTQQRHHLEQAGDRPGTCPSPDDWNPESTAIAVSRGFVGHEGLTEQLDDAPSPCTGHRYRDDLWSEHLQPVPRRHHGERGDIHTIDLDPHETVGPVREEPGDGDPEILGSRGCDGDPQHSVTVAPTNLLPTDDVGRMESCIELDRSDGPTRDTMEQPHEAQLPWCEVFGREMREVHDGDSPSSPVGTEVAIGGIDEQVVGPRDPLDGFAVVDDHHPNPGEIKAESLLEGGDVDRFMSDEINTMIEAEDLCNGPGIGLTTAGHRPEPVVDRDTQFVGRSDGHRPTNQGSRCLWGTSTNDRRRRRATSVRGNIRRKPPKATVRRRTWVRCGRRPRSTGITMSRLA